MLPSGEKALVLSQEDVKPTDILIGKGTVCTNHVGTIAFKSLIEVNVGAYMDEASKSFHKTFLTVEIAESIQSQGGRFLKQTKSGQPGDWVVLHKDSVREKVRDAFRDAVKTANNRRRGGLLNKIKLSQRFDKSHTFTDILNVVIKDPSVTAFLKAARAKETKIAKRKSRSMKKVAAGKEAARRAGNIEPFESSAEQQAPTLIQPDVYPVILPRGPIAFNELQELVPSVPIVLAPPLPMLMAQPPTLSHILEARMSVANSQLLVASTARGCCCGNFMCCNNSGRVAAPNPPPVADRPSEQPALIPPEPVSTSNATLPYNPWFGCCESAVADTDILRAIKAIAGPESDEESIEELMRETDQYEDDWPEMLDDYFDEEGRQSDLSMSIDGSLLVARV